MASKAEQQFKAIHPTAETRYVTKDANGHKRIGVYVGGEYFSCGLTRAQAYQASLTWMQTKADYIANNPPQPAPVAPVAPQAVSRMELRAAEGRANAEGKLRECRVYQSLLWDAARELELALGFEIDPNADLEDETLDTLLERGGAPV